MLFKGYFFLLYSDTSVEFPILHSNREKTKRRIYSMLLKFLLETRSPIQNGTGAAWAIIYKLHFSCTFDRFAVLWPLIHLHWDNI